MKRKIFPVLLAGICALCLVGLVAAAVNGENPYFRLGGVYHEANAGSTGPDAVVAEYKGQEILRSEVDYQKSVSGILGTAPQNGNADREIIDQIIKNMIVEEEANRLGYATTQKEIDEMVESVEYSYELPDGKEILNAYCEGAGITIEEYFELIRQQAPHIIAKRKLENAVAMEYCQEHGIEFTSVNPPEEMLEAVDDYMESLFESQRAYIRYYD